MLNQPHWMSSRAIAWVATCLALAEGLCSCSEVTDPSPRPQFAFEITPADGTTATDFLFDASKSGDDDDRSTVYVQWDWDADGAWDTPLSRDKTLQHRFLQPGVYTVRGRIVMAGDMQATAERTLSVRRSGWQDTWTSPAQGGNGLDAYAECLTVYQGDLVAGGDSGFLRQAGSTQVSGIARWDGRAWDNLGGGVSGTVAAMVEHAGVLVVAGNITRAGSQVVEGVAAWNGAAWMPLAEGLEGDVKCLASDGVRLYAGGDLRIPGDSSAANIVSWDGQAWSPIGAGADDVVECMTIYGSELVVSGQFHKVGGDSIPHLARWTGNRWTQLGPMLRATSGSPINDLFVFGDELVVLGLFTLVDDELDVDPFALWSGESWRECPFSLPDNYFARGAAANGTVYLIADGSDTFMYGWSPGSDWRRFGRALDSELYEADAYAITCWQNRVVVSGDFVTMALIPSSFIAVWEE